ncbi:MAG: phosphotransferase [Sulfurimonadaceae bacterium]|jgi:aminoglycoside/choline kinase family phosphotransferase|nr:phosphotransferase [Sulfurimonadaceae bacterium]
MEKVKVWLRTTPYKDFALHIASADASFRKYYRITHQNESYIVMDSSLEKESMRPFLDVTQKLLACGVHAPQILLSHLEGGYLILEDLGNILLLSVLNSTNFEGFYTKAIETIIKMQTIPSGTLAPYDKAYLHFEMDLMQEWYVQKLLQTTLTQKQKELINTTLASISKEVLSQPQDIFVHRDFHSRNIMLLEDDALGIIDYQDAMSGALTYDLVSLLKDCYITFGREETLKLALLFRDKKALDVDDATFIKWFDFTGLQRHIKVLGIFSRLYLRDAKDGYLKDIPLTLSYTLQTAKLYDETRSFGDLLEALTQSKAELTSFV